MWNLLGGTNSLSRLSHARHFLTLNPEAMAQSCNPIAPHYDQGNVYHARPLKIKFGQVQSTMDVSVGT